MPRQVAGKVACSGFETSGKKPGILGMVFSTRMLVAFIMGYASGLPLLLTLSVLQAWMKDAGVDLAVIGMMALVGLPYTLKFVWAPFMDRFTLFRMGRRRGWLLILQICLMGAIVFLGFSDPAGHPWGIAVAAFAVTFFSASQDIVIDAYRREDLSDAELGLGASFYINGYRIGMLLASGGGLIMADHIGFRAVYLIMAACLLPAVLTTLMAKEPGVPEGTPKTLKEAVIEPLTEYFRRKEALWILAFILLYKIGDTMASAMTTPFYLDIGFTKTQIGAVVKLFGFWATVFGSLLGGLVMLRLGIVRSLWVFGIFQALSTAGFAVLARIGSSVAALSGVIAFENLSSGMGTAAYAAFMASITNKKFTATQYALLSSLMGVPRVLASAPTGFLAKHMGWVHFFIACTLIAIPGMLLLLKSASWSAGRQEVQSA
ncbi:MAG: AmpG family muropeptide MFS transporter [Desulfobacterales bacterium]|jgi:PAT family beta-lactamase induction signal transducer AmpG|nr:AmpG family muropeptide MFS transporter [Desulfobacterales bacterium]MDD3081483.1 AmpG family muropeptide MFS transporter [Desulfobacterales bacterium]MDD3950442.1 AmpG family muropeptide MFS transporter [Desulfobacterales bacterium]MDD4462966.1 AmpG family muropeptide MFS transporter [Desulfobacterales bacterium]MDY0377761.1 AmpG family muropeptide MFS transporter [Desulfobacterales bacterium]